MWTDEAADVRRGKEEKESEKRTTHKKEDQSARKCRKVARHPVFPKFCGLVGSPKAVGAEPSG